ncbi:MAG: hypothetical protein E7408_03175 [Ruminococcaceae bacterium]|nr:hypothetical protein [Oscillospiraceae bacterium]
MDKQKEKLKQMLEAERAKAKGYEELAKIHGAYISILLKKLGCTKDNRFAVTPSDVREALEKYEARALPEGDGYGLYYEVLGE